MGRGAKVERRKPAVAAGDGQNSNDRRPSSRETSKSKHRRGHRTKSKFIEQGGEHSARDTGGFLAGARNTTMKGVNALGLWWSIALNRT